MKKTSGLQSIPPFPRILAIAMSALLTGEAQAASPFPQSPLGLGNSASQVPPNIVYTLDTSGSMKWDYLPDDAWYYTTKNGILQAAKAEWDSNKWYFYAPALNGVYFNFDISYLPGLHADQTPFPDQDPKSAQNSPYSASGFGTDITQVVYCESASAEPNPYSVPQGCRSTFDELHSHAIPVYAFYYQLNPGTAYPTLTRADYTRVNILDPAKGGSNNYPGPDGQTLTYTQEIHQFANWWSYYRSRFLTAQTVISQVFSKIPGNYRIAYSTIYRTPGAPKTWIDTSTNPPDTSTRDDFYDWLFRLSPSGATPLRTAINNIGKYYSDPKNMGTWGTPSKYLSCQKNFDILQTDGYWNGSFNGVGNRDGSKDTLPAAAPPVTAAGSATYNPIPPYEDGYANTLADIAFKYWATDLQPGIPDNVVASATDPATWQHLVVYGIGLGNPGTLAINHPGQSTSDLFKQIQGGNLAWPQPKADTPSTMDDLWHATVDSHGLFFNSKNPSQLTTALDKILTDIAAKTLTTVSVAVTGTALRQGSLAYVPSFTSGRWTGEVRAYAYDPGTAAFSTIPSWSAQGNLGTQGSSSRRIYTLNQGAAVAFQSANLSSSQKSALTNAPYVSGATLDQIIAHIRGDTSRDDILFRNRHGDMLGDIIGGNPQYVAAPNFLYTFPGYAQFLSSQNSRLPMLYVPANDGMLHAVNACAASYPAGAGVPGGCAGSATQTAGKELWAYIPNAILPYLDQRISLHNFAHRYLVDATPAVGDYCASGSGSGNTGTCNAWKTRLFAASGRGVPAVYSIDITQPDPTKNGFSPSPWEITPVSSGFDKIGYIIGQPLLIKTQEMGWVVVFGSGYQSSTVSSGNGTLYFVNPGNGQLLTSLTLPTQVSGQQLSITGIAASSYNLPGYAQALYVTDNQGNLWKIGLPANASPPQDTRSPNQAPIIAYGGQPMFVAKDGNSNRQPITTSPVVSRTPQGQYGVLFGTGQWLFPSDASSTNTVQSLYGIWDVSQSFPNVSTAVARTDLVQQTLTSNTSQNAANGTSYNTRAGSSNAVSLSSGPGGKKGWYVDLPLPGERVVVNPLLVGSVAFFTSYVPSDNAADPCINATGTSWITAVNYLTGAVPSVNPYGFKGAGLSATSIQVQGQVPQPTVTRTGKGLQLLLPGSGGTAPEATQIYIPFNSAAVTRAWSER
ncbi:pilus assembly protein [Acidithiobacillus sulfuriphilus]|uniref:pilus assembly protein n=1 Tax=Acidithiobacillus sulfuriphilus TaxID=1867749 RepID=UPI003F61472C